VLDDLVARGLKTPQLLITDGAAGLERALAGLWPLVPTQRCNVHNLLAHAREKLHEEITGDYTDMIYADSVSEIERRRRAFLRKWRLKCRAVAESLEEVGDRLFTFTRLPPSQWKSARTTKAIERLHEEFKRRINCLLRDRSPCARSTDGRASPRSRGRKQRLTSLPDPITITAPETSSWQFQHKSRRHPARYGLYSR
jgi:transposase-like protein